MRTTLTLDEDLAVKLRTEALRTGGPSRDVVSRRGLASRRTTRKEPLTLRVRDLGDFKQGLSLDNISELIEQIEGPLHR